MQNGSKLGAKIKAQVSRYCDRLSEGTNKAARRFFHEMVYGILATQDVKLSNVARTLDEEIPLIKTENRLSRQLAQRDWTELINKRLIERSETEIDFDSVLAVDLMDITKKYAKKMEGLRQVWDGSEGKIAWGYQTCSLIAAQVHAQKVVPLYHELYSSGSNDYRSENDQILKGISSVSKQYGPAKGIYVIDRAGDREVLIQGLLERSVKFLMRLVGSRHIEMGGHFQSVLQTARAMRCKYVREVTIETKEGIRETKVLHMGVKEIHLRFSEAPLQWVVIKGWSKEKPMMLLTNMESKNRERFAHKMLEIYLTRWKCEEGFRFIKQSYQLEDVRVRSLSALRNSMTFVHAVFYFISTVLGQGLKMNILLLKICQKAMRFFEVPSFKQYAIADGIYRVLFGGRYKPILDPNLLQNDQPLLPLNFAF